GHLGYILYQRWLLDTFGPFGTICMVLVQVSFGGWLMLRDNLFNSAALSRALENWKEARLQAKVARQEYEAKVAEDKRKQAELRKAEQAKKASEAPVEVPLPPQSTPAKTPAKPTPAPVAE